MHLFHQYASRARKGQAIWFLTEMTSIRFRWTDGINFILLLGLNAPWKKINNEKNH